MRKFMIAVAIAALTTGQPAGAQTAADRQTQLKEVIETALREQAVFLNCTAIDPQSHKIVRNNWEESAGKAAEHMSSANVDPAFVRAFRERAATEKLIRRDARFGEIIEMCQGDWLDRFSKLKFVLLDVRVRQILATP